MRTSATGQTTTSIRLDDAFCVYESRENIPIPEVLQCYPYLEYICSWSTASMVIIPAERYIEGE